MNKLNVDKKLAVGFDMDGVILDNADSKIKIAKKFWMMKPLFSEKKGWLLKPERFRKS